MRLLCAGILMNCAISEKNLTIWIQVPLDKLERQAFIDYS